VVKITLDISKLLNLEQQKDDENLYCRKCDMEFFTEGDYLHHKKLCQGGHEK
jgi:hypothetical protein